MIKRWYEVSRGWLGRHWKRVLVFGLGGVLVLTIIGQLFYPSDRMVPFATVEGQNYSGWSKSDVITSLDALYKNRTIDMYFKNASSVYVQPKPADIGLSIRNDFRINGLEYPWYYRLVPSSILWVHAITNDSSPSFDTNPTVVTDYAKKVFGEECHVEPQNASLRATDTSLEVVKSSIGGDCDTEKLIDSLLIVRPTLAEARVDIEGQEVKPAVSDAAAQNLADDILTGIGEGVTVTAGDLTRQIPKKELLSWMDFDTTSDKLEYSFNAKRASTYLNEAFAAKVAVKAGVTTVSTYDFVETSRVTGASGKALDVTGTLADIKVSISDSDHSAEAQTVATAPSVKYTRSYSPTDIGMAALMQNYAQTHPGVYGVSLVELSGARRHASYNGSKQFTTASTYKLFVAYSTLLRIESGAFKWSDQITGGRDLSTCFEDMIVRSDNACAQALVKKIGNQTLTNEAKAIGSTNTTFMVDNYLSTPQDQTVFLAALHSGQLLSRQSSRDKLLDAMRRNVYRQGIPKGIPSATVANKVGFLDGLLHDSGIVYAPTGTYALVIFTDGASWGNIAQLAGQIEALRSQ